MANPNSCTDPVSVKWLLSATGDKIDNLIVYGLATPSVQVHSREAAKTPHFVRSPLNNYESKNVHAFGLDAVCLRASI